SVISAIADLRTSNLESAERIEMEFSLTVMTVATMPLLVTTLSPDLRDFILLSCSWAFFFWERLVTYINPAITMIRGTNILKRSGPGWGAGAASASIVISFIKSIFSNQEPLI